MPAQSDTSLSGKRAEAQKKIDVTAYYSHYKHPELPYKIICVAIIEATEAPCVVYQALYGEQLTFVRPVSSWLETVEHNGSNVPRFSKLDTLPAAFANQK